MIRLVSNSACTIYDADDRDGNNDDVGDNDDTSENDDNNHNDDNNENEDKDNNDYFKANSACSLSCSDIKRSKDCTAACKQNINVSIL